MVMLSIKSLKVDPIVGILQEFSIPVNKGVFPFSPSMVVGSVVGISPCYRGRNGSLPSHRLWKIHLIYPRTTYTMTEIYVRPPLVLPYSL